MEVCWRSKFWNNNNLTIQYAQKQSILGSKNGLKLTKIVHIAQMSTDEIRNSSAKLFAVC